MSQLRKWDNGVYEWDVTKASREMNPWLDNYGRDRLTYDPEMTHHTAREAFRNEQKFAHGYPFTAYLQVAMVYAAGLYTAKEQGIVKKGVYFQNFFRAHYFDWILFFRRSALGAAGGFALGVVMFGNYDLSLKRAVSKYHYLFSMQKPDPRNTET